MSLLRAGEKKKKGPAKLKKQNTDCVFFCLVFLLMSVDLIIQGTRKHPQLSTFIQAIPLFAVYSCLYKCTATCWRIIGCHSEFCLPRCQRFLSETETIIPSFIRKTFPATTYLASPLFFLQLFYRLRNTQHHNSFAHVRFNTRLHSLYSTLVFWPVLACTNDYMKEILGLRFSLTNLTSQTHSYNRVISIGSDL